jgi:signal peptide peptidase SppA
LVAGAMYDDTFDETVKSACSTAERRTIQAYLDARRIRRKLDEPTDTLRMVQDGLRENLLWGAARADDLTAMSSGKSLGLVSRLEQALGSGATPTAASTTPEGQSEASNISSAAATGSTSSSPADAPTLPAKSGRARSGATAAVGIVCLQGPILPSTATQSSGAAGLANHITLADARRQLRAAETDPSIRAVVLRIDSPGGEALASAAIWHEVRRLRDAGKPVVASLGSVGASGGYMIAAACDKIVAQPATLTGSIGVLAGALDASGFLRQQRASLTLLSKGPPPLGPARPLSRQQREDLRQLAADSNRDFEAKVAEGRGLSARAVRRVAQGRVWTGEQAAAIGLVDTLGGADDACRLACEAAGIGEQWASRKVERRELCTGGVRSGVAAFEELAPSPSSSSVSLASLIGALSGELPPQCASLCEAVAAAALERVVASSESDHGAGSAVQLAPAPAPVLLFAELPPEVRLRM